MAVYLPTAAVGNGRILVTIGASGEVMSLCWPHLDFANNVHECMPAVYLGEHRQGEFLWTWQEEFSRRQYYLGETNILVTQLKIESAGLDIILTDFCPPDEDAFVRRVRVENRSGGRLSGLFMHYFDLRLGEVPWKQAVRYDAESGIVIQYFRDIAVGVGGTRPDLWRCGKWSRQETNAKLDMYDGYLDGQPEDIGEVNFALAWRLDIEQQRHRDIEIIVHFAPSRQRATAGVQRLAKIGAIELQKRTHAQERQWLQRRKMLRVPQWLDAAYKRGLLSIKMLSDHRTGAIVAAPEFDPTYEMCGGYGYCWPRDAAEAAVAMEGVGYAEYLEDYACWLARVQLPDGHWGQRYWSDGSVAASWALRRDFLQLDQTASAVVAMVRACGEGNGSALELRGYLWPAIRKGAVALLDQLDEHGFHAPACDLWETYAGVFTYTQAAVVAALRAGSECAASFGYDTVAETLRAGAEKARVALLSLYTGEYFARGRMDGRVDLTVDSSVLGVVVPYYVVDLTEDREREMVVRTLDVIEQRLGQNLAEGRAIKRYEGDGYLGGVVGAVNTLWTGLVCYELALTAASREEAQMWQKKAEQYLQVALAHTTPTGLLPELIPVEAGIPYWAAPHAWASGLVIRCAMAADRLAAKCEANADASAVRNS